MSAILTTAITDRKYPFITPALGNPHDLDKQAQPNRAMDPGRPGQGQPSLHNIYQTMDVRMGTRVFAGVDELEVTARVTEIWLPRDIESHELVTAGREQKQGMHDETCIGAYEL